MSAILQLKELKGNNKKKGDLKLKFKHKCKVYFKRPNHTVLQSEAIRHICQMKCTFWKSLRCKCTSELPLNCTIQFKVICTENILNIGFKC